MRAFLSLSLFVFFLSTLAHAVVCVDLYPTSRASRINFVADPGIRSEQLPVDQIARDYILEIEQFERQVGLSNEIRVANTRLESIRNARRANNRRTREIREMRINEWRMSLRTRDVYRVLEEVRLLYGTIRGQASILHRGRLLLNQLERPTVLAMMGRERYNSIRESLTEMMDEAIQHFDRRYGNYWASVMVLRELGDSGELSTILANHGLTLEEVKPFIEGETNTLPIPQNGEGLSNDAIEQITQQVQRFSERNEFLDSITQRLSPTALERALMPAIYDSPDSDFGDYSFISSVFRGSPELYGQGVEIYRQDGPIRRLIQDDLRAEIPALAFSMFMRLYQPFMDAYIWTTDFTGRGEIEMTDQTPGFLRRFFLNRGDNFRNFFHIFAKAYVDRRSRTHFSDLEGIHKIMETNVTDLDLLEAVRSIATAHGERNFFMTWARIPYYQSDLVRFERLLRAAIENQADAPYSQSVLQATLDNLNAATVRAISRGPLDMTTRPHVVNEIMQTTILTAGTVGMVRELSLMLSQWLPEGMPVLRALGF
jgi:hypothetical protein